MEYLGRINAEMIDVQVLIDQSEKLINDVQLREQKIMNARNHIREALKEAGDWFPESAKRELNFLTGGQPSPEIKAYRQTKELHDKRETETVLQKILSGTNQRTIMKTRDVDLDMAGRYDIVYTWNIKTWDDITTIEKTTRELGYTYSRGTFDDTTYETFITSSRLTQPLSIEKSISELPISNNGTIDVGSFKLDDWYILSQEAEEIAQKAAVDDIATECLELLQDETFMPGKWSGTRVKRHILKSQDGSITWTLAQLHYDDATEPFEIILQTDGPNDSFSNARLRSAEGTFESHPGTTAMFTRSEQYQAIFVEKLACLKMMLNTQESKL